MGQIEKIFVIAIVLLVGLVLGVTILSRGGDSGAANPVAAAEKGDKLVIQGGIDPVKVADLMKDPPAEIKDTAADKAEPVTPPPASPAPAPKDPPKQPEPLVIAKPVAFPFVNVKPGETLGQILERELGSATRYLKEVLELNEDLDPNRLVAGQRIWLPPARVRAKAEAAALQVPGPPVQEPPKAEPATRTYKVKPGDNLYKIAKDQLPALPTTEGIKRLKQANAGKSLDPLRVGLVLNLPR